MWAKNLLITCMIASVQTADAINRQGDRDTFKKGLGVKFDKSDDAKQTDKPRYLSLRETINKASDTYKYKGLAKFGLWTGFILLDILSVYLSLVMPVLIASISADDDAIISLPGALFMIVSTMAIRFAGVYIQTNTAWRLCGKAVEHIGLYSALGAGVCYALYVYEYDD